MADLIAIALACGLAAEADLVAAIVAVESGGNPIALQVNGEMELVRQPRDRKEAIAFASWLLAHRYNFDAGLAQVNSANYARLGLDATSVFEPCTNLRAAAAVLRECRERAQGRGLKGGHAERAALSCYNTGDLTRGVANGYAAAVRAALHHTPPSSTRPLQPAAVPPPSTFPTTSRRPEVFVAYAAAEPRATSFNPQP